MPLFLFLGLFLSGTGFTVGTSGDFTAFALFVTFSHD
jgi:hypothetical protein